jgi:hypothetical protein
MPATRRYTTAIDARGSMPSTPRARDMLPGGYGSYRYVARTGTIGAGAAAASEIMEFRFSPADTNMRAVLRRLWITATSLGTGFTAGQVIVEAKFARAFTVAGTGGGAITLTTNMAKMRTVYGTSLAEGRIATTAAMTAGTQTLDTRGFASVESHATNAAYVTFLGNNGIPVDLFRVEPGSQEITFAPDEGFVVLATVPATGTWEAAVGLEWDEVQVSNL